MTGVRAARGTWIATLDGDGQNDPADIPALLARAQAEAGLVLTAGHRVTRRDTRTKRLASRLANRIRARLLRDATPDTGCGLKVFRRDAFLALPHFDHMHRYLPALFIRAGGRVVSVPVNHRPRTRGRSNYGTLDRLWVGDLRPGRRVLAAAAVEAPRGGRRRSDGARPHGGLLWKPALLLAGLLLAGLAVRGGWGRRRCDAPAQAGPVGVRAGGGRRLRRGGAAAGGGLRRRARLRHLGRLRAGPGGGGGGLRRRLPVGAPGGPATGPRGASAAAWPGWTGSCAATRSARR